MPVGNLPEGTLLPSCSVPPCSVPPCSVPSCCVSSHPYSVCPVPPSFSAVCCLLSCPAGFRTANRMQRLLCAVRTVPFAEEKAGTVARECPVRLRGVRLVPTRKAAACEYRPGAVVLVRNTLAVRGAACMCRRGKTLPANAGRGGVLVRGTLSGYGCRLPVTLRSNANRVRTLRIGRFPPYGAW